MKINAVIFIFLKQSLYVLLGYDMILNVFWGLVLCITDSIFEFQILSV